MSVKTERMMVMMTTETLLRLARAAPLSPSENVLLIQFTRGPAKLSAANALPKNPERVMATCMVARKRAGCDVSFLNFTARSLHAD